MHRYYVALSHDDVRTHFYVIVYTHDADNATEAAASLYPNHTVAWVQQDEPYH